MYDGYSMEEVYDELYENADKIDIEQLVDQLLDEHLDEEGDGSGTGGQPEEDENGNLVSKKKPSYTKEQRQEIRDQIKESLLQSCAGASAGEMPAGVKRIIKDLTEPKMPWQELLNMSIQSTLKGDYSFMKRSKKGHFTDVALPGQTPEETIDIALSMDMSGSISDTMGKEMLSEVKGIMEQFQDFRIKLWCFDTNVYNYAEFTPQNIDGFQNWLRKNNFDPHDPELSLGYLKLGDVDLINSFGTINAQDIWKQMADYLDIVRIECGDTVATYDYHWSDSDHEQRQLESLG